MHKRTDNFRINSGAMNQTKIQHLPPQQMVNHTIRKSSVTGQQNAKNLQVTYERPPPKNVINPPRINKVPNI